MAEIWVCAAYNSCCCNLILLHFLVNILSSNRTTFHLLHIAGYAGVQRAYTEPQEPAALCAWGAPNPQQVPELAVASNV
jgi:hypothetical protein